MANRALPIMVINISCEMIYVLEERLVAQDVPAEKRAKVLNDMCKAAFDPEALESMFQPQPLYEQGQLLTLVTHLASASIIRLSENSLRKLFDLVLMTLKYQMMLIKCSPELLAVTLNHLDGVVTTMNINESSLALIEQCRQRLLKHFAATPYGTWDRIRHSIYCVLQDKHTRVSLFLQAKFQTKDGRFFLPRSGPLPPFVSIPGTVTFHRQEGDTTKSYQVSQYGPVQKGVLYTSQNLVERGTVLGENLYRLARAGKIEGVSMAKPLTATSDIAGPMPKVPAAKPTVAKPAAKPGSDAALRGLDILSRIVGAARTPSDDHFQLSFLDEYDSLDTQDYMNDELLVHEATNYSVLHVDATKQENALSAIALSLDFPEPDANPRDSSASKSAEDAAAEDLLALMDGL
eukprot:m.39560 g.39560  ORF g.39560 m.39560 type:complete len:405 (+) comp10318_c1_seq2:39-1253(+)